MKVQAYILSLFKKTPFGEIVKDLDNLEIIKGAGTTFTLKIVGLAFSYVFNIFFARLYGAEVMGIYALAITVAGIFSLFGQMGTETSLVRFVAQYAGQGNYSAVTEIYKKTIQLVLPASILFAAFFYMTSPWIANDLFHKPRLTIPFRITAFVLPFGALMSVNTSSLRGLKKIKDAFLFSTALPPILNTAGLMGLTYFVMKNYLTPIYVNLMTAIIGAFLSFKLWYKWKNKLVYEKSKKNKIKIPIKEIMKISLPMFMTSAMLFIMGWTDIFMIGVFRSANEVGIYRIALKIALLSSFTLGAVNSISAPKFSELYWNSENDRLKKVIKSSSKIIFWSSLPIFLILIILPNQMLSIFGGEFVEGKNALIILSFGQFLNAYFGSVGVLLDMTGNQKVFRNAIIVGAAFNILLNYILIPPYGISGAAIATSFSTIVWNLIASLAVLKIFSFWVGYIPDFVIKRV